MNSKKRYCEYNICIVDHISQKWIYVKKFVILLIGYLYLIVSARAFTFFTVALYVAPMFIDDSYAILQAIDHKLMIYIDRVTKLINFAIVLGCVAGASGFLIDTGKMIKVVETALNVGGIAISKEVISLLLFMNIVEVVIMMVFVPGKNDSLLLKNFKQKEVENQEVA